MHARNNESTRLIEELSRSSERKDRFIAVLAHELRNPLAPLLASLEVLELAADQPEIVSRARAIMRRQLNQLARLVEDLLDVSRIARGQMQLSHEPVDIAGVVAAAVETVQPLIESRGQHFTSSLPQSVPAVMGDAGRLTQVLVNLLDNAAKYTNPGGDIRLTVAREGTRMAIRIRDSGVGIAPETLPQIFEMYTQADPHARNSDVGLGIGLALARQVVELHDGTLEAHSEGADRGSEFVVRLPTLHSV